MKSLSSRRLALVFVLLFAGLMMPFALSAVPTFVNANQPDLPEVARGIPKGGALRVTGFDLDQFGIVELELERFIVFAPDVEILVDGSAPILPPNNVYFRGRAETLPNAIVLLIVPEHGKMRGIITDEAGVWLLAGNSGRGAPGLTNKKVKKEALASLPPFECGTDALPITIGKLTAEKPGSVAHLDTSALPANVTHTARVAIETDYEYYAIFGNVTAALNYTGDIFAYSSAVYEREVNTNLVISYTKFWPNGATSDPWSATSGTPDALYEFRDYWNSNMGGEDRTIAHMLSGKSLGGGIAYLSVLCNTAYGYGLSANLHGDFNINNPGVVWDIMVMSHEIGHNFSSSHTQDYCGIGGNSNPVDLCYNSAASCGTALGLPGVGTLSGGSTVNRPGTIMSYCHQVSGGMSNIGFTFGKDHIYGVAANRVPLVMYNHVLNRAATYPSCLALVNDGTYRLSVSKNGNGIVNSSPSGINCGSDCSEYYTEGTTVTLMATPDSGESFFGWDGACSGTASCVVNMTAAKSVSATFSQGGDQYEPDNTSGQATTIQNGVSQTHSIIPANDVDWIKFSLTTTTDIVLETSGPSGDTRLWLYDSSLTEIAFDDDGGSSLFSRISETSLPLGTYYAKVDEYGNNNEISSYSILLTVAYKTYNLSASKTGNGTIISSPPGINCGSDCSEVYVQDTSVTLTATPDSGWGFSLWGGACSGTGTCMVTMTSAKSVSATFTYVSQNAGLQPILYYILRSHKSTSSSTQASAASTIPRKICATGMVYDCEEKCVDEVIALDWVGDGVCNDGTHEMNLLCPAFQNDGGDCN